MKKIKNFIRNNEAATAIEYGLIAALIAVVAITAMTQVGSGVNNAFLKAKVGLDNANTPTAPAGTQ
jgi:pilus assembly protein Flp/PilA